MTVSNDLAVVSHYNRLQISISMSKMSNSSEIMAQSTQNIRLLSQLKYLELLQPPLTYRICHRAKRTIILVEIDPDSDQLSPKNHIEHPTFELFEKDIEEMNNQMELQGREKQSFWVSKKVNNRLSAQLGSQCIIYQKNIEENELEEIDFSLTQERQQSRGHVTFVIVLHHDLYPFEPPLITITNWNSFPRIDDFKNYYYDIMEAERWWPLITLQDIIQKMPAFAAKLNRNAKKGFNLLKMGIISQEHPLWIEDIKEFGSGLLLFSGKAKIKNDSLVTFFREKMIGLSCQFVAVIERKQNDELWVQKYWNLNDLQTHTLREGKKHFQLSFTWKEEPYFTFKIPYLTLTELAKEKMKLYSAFFSLLSVSDNKNEPSFDRRVKIYSQIMSHGDWIQDQHVVSWGRQKIRSLAKVHPQQ